MGKLTRRSDGRAVKKILIEGEKKAKYFYSSKKSDREAERDILQQILAYESNSNNRFKFSEVSKEWENLCYENIEYQSAKRYETYVKHLNDYFCDTYISEITFEDINRFLKSFVYKGYSSKTIKDQTSITKKIFAYAFTQKYTTTDFSYYIKAPKGKPSTTRDALTDEEVEIVEKSIDCTFGFFAYFLMYTGLRKGEALALQYKDIDFENNTISVTKSVYYANNTPYIKIPKTVAGFRKVILLEDLKNKIPKNNNKEALIFSFDGTLIRNSLYTRKWNKYIQESGLEDVTAHRLRHTYATFLYEADIKIKDAQVVLGHSDPMTTQRIYNHIREKQALKTSEQLSAFFNSRKAEKLTTF